MSETSSVTYHVKGMRVVKPQGKTAERNPERLFTVYGQFYATVEDAKGNLVPTDKLSIVSKNIDYEDAESAAFSLDVASGTLTMPEGRRGRTAAQGLSQDDILAELAALRGEDASDDEDASE
jgi:hypothetical protein